MTEKQAEKLALPIIGIVLGSLGLLLSWVPIVNNFAFILAIVALILTGISFFVNRGGKKTLTYISLGLAIATGAVVLLTQASYSKALDTVSDSVSSSVSNDKKDSKKLIEGKVGETIDLDGVKYTINSVDFPADSEFNKAEDGKTWVVANITIKNESGSNVSYNPFDYKLDADGNSTDFSALNTDVDGRLSSGDLKDGATVTGNLVGEADKSKTLKLEHYDSMIADDPNFSVTLN